VVAIDGRTMAVNVSEYNRPMIDQWWDVFQRSYSFIELEQMRSSDRETTDETEWEDIDAWWESAVNTSRLERTGDGESVLERNHADRSWSEFESWWGLYEEVRQEDIQELKAILENQEKAWKESNSRFDSDPLTADWTDNRRLWPHREEEWSDWLAHILGESPEEVLNQLFPDQFEETPHRVDREHYVRAVDPDEANRYADIVLRTANRGISIEVKLGDTNYAKTEQTAALVEREDTRRSDWMHMLILPKSMASALEQSFEEAFEETDGGRKIKSDIVDSITVIYWEEVTSLLRDVLRDAAVSNSHWESSAYIGCTLIEQQLLNYLPRPVIDQIDRKDGLVSASKGMSASQGISQQLSYFKNLGEDQDE
jgi:hypothetical protein